MVSATRWCRRHGLRWTAWAATLGLLGFHARLLIERLANGSLARPAVAAQWVAAGTLVAWVWWARRRGISLISGRRALAFWVLVLLLHAVPAMPGGAAMLQPDGSPLLLVAPFGLALAAAAALLALLVSAHWRPTLTRARRRPHLPVRPATAGYGCALVPRAPPV
ncbi:MAG: hypothetical protein R2991_09540 [Thermoanaerobaculia bacterium]